MNKLIAEMSMSLDGFIADENDGVEHLFGWYSNGDVEVRTANPGITLRVTGPSADFIRPTFEGGIGAVICGRRVYDLANGWNGRHPVGSPVFVVTHEAPADRPSDDMTFWSDPADALAAARKAAGDRDIAVATPSLIRQYLNAGELDRIVVALVPVLLGKGVRYFDGLADVPVRLSDPAVVQGKQVTHLAYDVLR